MAQTVTDPRLTFDAIVGTDDEAVWDVRTAADPPLVDGHGETRFSAEEANRVLAERAPRPDLSPDPDLPDDTRLWAALQNAGGGTWGGCSYDVDRIVEALKP